MMQTVYIEKEVIKHPRTQRILQRLPVNSQTIECNHYGEIFNPKNQNFRLQKQQPALILAQKQNEHVLKTPEGFGIGGEQNYYFSHMLNCIYDCRYCFLQGMYPSANLVLFVNYEDFMTKIADMANEHDQAVYFFSGYDCDSLAYEGMTQFAREFLPFFAQYPKAILELRTKSTNIKPLLDHEPIPNCVTAYSFTPPKIAEAVEHKVPNIEKRLQAMQKLAQRGWQIGLRLDPLIAIPDFEEQYQRLIQAIFDHIDAAQVHSVSVGPMRFPAKMYHQLKKLYPNDWLLAQPLYKREGQYTYGYDREQAMEQLVFRYLRHYVPESTIFSCYHF